MLKEYERVNKIKDQVKKDKDDSQMEVDISDKPLETRKYTPLLIIFPLYSPIIINLFFRT